MSSMRLYRKLKASMERISSFPTMYEKNSVREESRCSLPLMENHMKVKTPCHIIGIRKDIRQKIGKQPGDVIHVTILERP